MMRWMVMAVWMVGLYGCGSGHPATPNNPYTPAATERSAQIVIKDLYYPEWIAGVWHTAYESNAEMFVHCLFTDNQFLLINGIPGDKPQVVEPYKDYAISEEANASQYIIILTRNGKEIRYRFRKEVLDWDDTPHLSYEFTEDGQIIDGIGMMKKAGSIH